MTPGRVSRHGRRVRASLRWGALVLGEGMKRASLIVVVVPGLVGSLLVVGAGGAGAKSNGAAKSCATVQQLSTELKAGPLSDASVGALAGAARLLKRAKVNGASDQAAALSAAVAGSRKAQRKAVAQTVKWCKAMKVTPLTTTTTLPQLQRAQNAYFIMSSAANEAVRNAEGLSAQEGCTAAAAAEEKFAQDLKAYTDWPASAQAAIDALANGLAADAGVFYACGRGEASQSAIDASRQASAAAASAVRLALQLPIDRS